ncbi:hypothetical protein [Saccharopolyspora sp. 6V]|uniref:hypothetical protein n=1 Tax=Saccharopolyspora sp. 6V TaxID=2877239 RepID=UPI001CD805C0|nr:hypothetical protein [Saccharopolyspora sp. 6V]MCA1195156.1 hypothetical protein [Saccharopolyspora sp. 6V]
MQRVALRRLAPPLTRARPITRATPRRLPAITAPGTDAVQTDAAPPGPDVDLVLQRRADADAPPERSDAPRPTAPSSPGTPADSGTAPSTAGTGSTAPGGPPGTRPTLGADRSPEQSGLGGPVQRMPSGAVPLHHESTGSPEPPPPVQRAAEPAPEQQPDRPSRPGRGRKRPTTSKPEVRRSTPNSRGGLGEPLGRLPESATPLRPGGTPPTSGPVVPGGAAEAAPLLGDAAPQVQRTPSTRTEPRATTPDDPAPADPVATPLAGSSAEPAGTGPATPVQRSRIQDAAGAPPHGGADHGTAPLLGDTTIQRSASGTPAHPAGAPGHSPSAELPTAQRNPATPSSSRARQPPVSATRHSPGPASQQSSGPATAPHRAAIPVRRSSSATAPEAAAPHGTPVQRLTAPSGADAPETPLAENAPTGPHEVSTGTHSVQRARPDSPDEPAPALRPHHDPTHLSAPVQRARPLLTTRPLTTRTRLDQPRPNATAPPTEHRAVAPLRWTRREPGDRPADPAPVQRSATPAALPAVAAEPPPPDSAAAEPAPAPPGSATDGPDARPPMRAARPVQRRTAPESPPAARSAPTQDEPTPQVPGVPPGVPVTVVPKQHQESADPEPTTGTGGEQDIDELARRLIEPVGRLLRTELRHGRERFGRTYDRRR